MNIKSTPSFHNWPIAIVVALGTFIFSCNNDDDPVMPDPELATVKFSSTSLSIGENSSSALAVDLTLSKALEEAGTVTISIDNGSTATSSDYSTYPEASSGAITLSLPEGTTSASFSVTPVDNSDANDDKTIIFNLSSADGGVGLVSSDLTATITITNDDEPSAGILLNENFDYGTTAGDLTALSSWEVYSGTDFPIQYIVDGLSLTGYENSGVGGAIAVENGDGSRQDVTRSFASQNSGTVYTAQLINISQATASATGDFFMSLRNASGKYFNRLYAKDDGSGNLLLGTARTRSGGGSEVYSTTAFSYNTTYLVVIKYDFSTKETSMFVMDDSIPATEPETPDVVADTGEEPASFEDIIIRQSSDDIAATIDGIRIANTWKDALGI
jgi:hypothetical protein